MRDWRRAPSVCTIVTIVATSLLAVSGPAAGSHCNGTVTAIDLAAETLYVDDRGQGSLKYDHWFYLERNGVPGLQSGGAHHVVPDPIVPSFSDGCRHPDPDQLLF